jgi:ABC-type uncharacterized transport system permease subunit
MLRLEPRAQPSKLWRYASPLLALAITVVLGVILFVALGKDPVRGLHVFFWEPIKSVYALSELIVKATPLLLIALGLAVCFRSNVWNIGAEGQFVMGAVFASGVALMADANTGAGFWGAHFVGGYCGRHGVGGYHRVLARPLSCQRNFGQPHAGVRSHHGAQLLGLWPLERPIGLQLSANQNL